MKRPIKQIQTPTTVPTTTTIRAVDLKDLKAVTGGRMHNMR